ncbi:MAG: hypothetical protein HFI83_04555 [Eubacterium sp.]|nr:hypothetical protein [Eubacterium sp.]
MSIMGAVSAAYLSNMYGASAAGKTKKEETSGGQEKVEPGTTGEFVKKYREKAKSPVEEYKTKHPEDAAHVEKQVKAGEAIRRKNGVQDVSTEDMTMEEYKRYFYALLDTIPCDPSRVNDQTMISITDAGWEQMKQDPDYEAWILGYFVEDRSVRNPFYGWGGNTGMFITEHFGASIEEHHGEGFTKTDTKKTKKDDEESWWSMRHKRMKKYLKEQAVLAQKREQSKEKAAQQEYIRQQYESSVRLHSFLTEGVRGEQSLLPDTESAKPSVPLLYDGMMDLFSTIRSKG